MAKFSSSISKYLNLIVIVGIIFLINIIGQYVYRTFDLTEERKYTLTDNTVDYLENLDSEIFVKVWLEGDFPSGFERLSQSAKDILTDFSRINSGITFDFSDPNEGSIERVNEIRQELAKDGMRPLTLRIEEQGETVDKIIYPYVQIYRGKEYITVNLLAEETSSVQNENTLSESVALLEYQLINGIKTISSEDRPAVIFTTGRGEPNRVEMADFINSLNSFYKVGRVNLDSIPFLSEEVKVLIVADPTEPFSEKDKFKIDQYMMRGGRVLWLVDKLVVNVDSIARNKFYVPLDQNLNIDDLLFSYGARVQPNLVLDMECTKIPLQTGVSGNQPQFELFPWYYHVAATPSYQHPIVKNLDRINLFFPSSIDTIRTHDDISKTSLLKSSQYSRIQFNPVRLNFEVVRYDPDVSKFNQGSQNLAVLYEGKFNSHFKDRVTQGLLEGLQRINRPFVQQSDEAKMIVISDGDMIKNLIDPDNGSFRPLGFNPYENYVFDNKNFLLNCVDYLISDGSVLEARSKKYKLRLMDRTKLESEYQFWQWLNLIGPIALLFIFGILYYWIRKRRFT